MSAAVLRAFSRVPVPRALRPLASASTAFTGAARARAFGSTPARRADDDGVSARPTAEPDMAQIIGLLRESQYDVSDEVEPGAPEPVLATGGRGGPLTQHEHLENFRMNSHIMPHHFSLKHASRTGPVGRRPKLGPDARDARARDPFLALRVDPLAEAANTALVSAFVTDMGKIHGRAWTGLSRRSQRRAGQAVRRARMLGLIPWLSRRPLAQGVLTRTARGVSSSDSGPQEAPRPGARKNGSFI